MKAGSFFYLSEQIKKMNFKACETRETAAY